MMKHMISLIAGAFLWCAATAQTDTTQHVIEGRVNSVSQQNKPYVILISADGFRYDYAEKYQAKYLLALRKKGVSATSMIPAYPTLTFPNHYSIVTGLYPSHHGLVNNNFYDPQRKGFYRMSNVGNVRDSSWYSGTPLWVLAEQQQMLTASFYWVSSEAAIQGIRPTYYYNYNEKITIGKRIQTVVDWLKLPSEKRPHLITFYFPEVDHEGHLFGPDAPETEHAVHTLDSSVNEMTIAVTKLGLNVNFIFVSDHGMTKVDNTNTLLLPAGIDTSKFLIPSEGNLVEMYAKNKADILPAYELLKKNESDYKVYLKRDMPRNLHYRTKDDKMNRIGDIMILPNCPKVYNFYRRKLNIGWHGYDAYAVKDMHATFIAWGPAFKQNVSIPSFENIHVYPLITTLLGLEVSDKIDGKKKVLKKLLKK